MYYDRERKTRSNKWNENLTGTGSLPETNYKNILFKCQECDFFMSYKDKWFIILSSCPLFFYIYFTTRESSEGVTALVKGSLAPRSKGNVKIL